MLQPEQFHVEREPEAADAGLSRWFCVAVAPREGAMDSGGGIEIERRLKAAGFDAFVPVAVRVLPPKGPRRKAIERKLPLFRGYAFVRLQAPVSRADWSAVCNVDGVVRIISTTSGPSPVPVGLVEALQASGPVREQSQSVATRFRKRMLARVTNGPWANFIGMISRADSDKRIEIMLRVFGRETKVTVPVSILEPVETRQRPKRRP